MLLIPRLPLSSRLVFGLLLSGLLLSLTSCANSPLGASLQKSLEADPELTETSPTVTPTTSPAASPSVAAIAQLPNDFPPEIPLYPNRELRQVKSATGNPAAQADDKTVETLWVTADQGDRVLSFYQQELEKRDWRLLEQPPANADRGAIVARRNALKLTVTVQPTAGQPATGASSGNTGSTEFVLLYGRSVSAGQASPSPTGGDLMKLLPFTDSVNAGATSNANSASPPASAAPLSFTDIDKTPKELRQYVTDLAALGVLNITASSTKAKTADNTTLFEPNKTLTRREYVRWLVATNNRLYANRAAQQIRLGLETAQPVFQDVPRTDPDFGAIQGLADAGLLPSTLSGDSTTVTFRPNEPLTRENMLLWKVPMDTRQALPTAAIDAVKQTWGFQDTARIEPRALRAVLADYQNGDLANIRRAFGYTTLFQPKKPVTRAEAAATLWYFGFQGEGQSAQDVLKAEQTTP